MEHLSKVCKKPAKSHVLAFRDNRACARHRCHVLQTGNALSTADRAEKRDVAHKHTALR